MLSSRCSSPSAILSVASRHCVFHQPRLPSRFSGGAGVPLKPYKIRWKISCFRNDDYLPVNRMRDPVDSILPVDREGKDSVKPDRRLCDLITKVADAADRATGRQWTVPWKAETIAQVMLLWIVSFWFIGSWAIPFVAHLAGFSKASLTLRGQALFSLVTDVAEGVAGITILRHCLFQFQPFPSDWFSFKLKGKWWIDVAVGCLMFPLVNRLSQFNLSLLPVMPSTAVALSTVEQSIAARDAVAMSVYAVVVSVCTPIWEEIVFRGFLLPSLTKYMPVWCAILVSSVAFALAHFNVQRMLPLIFLGIVMGLLFTRSRNLLPSMLLHSLWNAFVFLDLMSYSFL